MAPAELPAWQAFWDRYRRYEAASEDDLFVQVGKTVGGRPIAAEVFARMLARVRTALSLTADDVLVDLCCGNGLLSFELAADVREVVAVDFAAHLIGDARRFKQRENIRYRVGDILEQAFVDLPDDGASRFLMNDCLAYFDPARLHDILVRMLASRPRRGFRFVATDVPDHRRRGHFYDTAERRARLAELEARGDGLNDGVGRWWRADEIREVCAQLDLDVAIDAGAAGARGYRMDVLITQSAAGSSS